MRMQSGLGKQGLGRIAKALGATKRVVSYDKFDHLEQLRQHMDDTTILEELCRAMSDQEAEENLDWIIQMHAIPIDSDDEDEY